MIRAFPLAFILVSLLSSAPVDKLPLLTGLVITVEGTPIPFAEVEVDGNRVTVAAADGSFTLRNISQFPVTLRARHSGFETATLTVSSTEPSPVVLRLAPRTYPLPPVLIEGSRYGRESARLPIFHGRVDVRGRPASGNGIADQLGPLGLPLLDYGGAAGVKTISSPTGKPEHVLLLLDGIPLTSAQSGGVDVSLLPAFLFRAAEHYAGHGSSLYGSGAIGGVINLIPNRELDRTLSVTRGSYGEHGATAGWGTRIGEAALSISGSTYSNKGDFRENNHLHQSGTKFELSTPLTGGWRGSYLGFRTETDRGVSGSIEYSSPNASRSNTDWFHLASVAGTSRLGRTEVAISFVQDEERYRDPDYAVNSHHTSSTSRIFALHRFSPKARLDRVLTGEIAHRRVSSADLGLVAHTQTLGALGGLVQVRPAEPLEISAAVRAERPEGGRTTTTGSFGLHWRPKREAIESVTFNAGSSYRLPSFNDLYWSDPYSEGNPQLQPERGRSVEVGLRLAENFGANAIRISLRGYHYFTENLIEWLPDENYLWTPSNLQSSESFGASVSGELGLGRLPIFLTVRSEVRHSGVLSAEAKGQPLLYTPDRSDWAQLEYRGSRARFQISYLALGRRRFSHSNPKALPDYRRLDLAIRITGPKLAGTSSSIDLAVRNAADQKQESVKGYPEPGRIISVQTEFAW